MGYYPPHGVFDSIGGQRCGICQCKITNMRNGASRASDSTIMSRSKTSSTRCRTPSSCERVRRFLPAIFSVRHPRKRPPILVSHQSGQPNSENAYLGGPPTKSVIYAALGLPPRGDPLDFLIPPKALVVVDSRQSGPPSHRYPGGVQGGQLLGPPMKGGPLGGRPVRDVSRGRKNRLPKA